MKKLKLPLLLAIAAMSFGFTPGTANAQSRGHHHHHRESVVRHYNHHDGWRYKVVRYYDHHCRTWRERHVKVSRCNHSYDSHRNNYRSTQVAIGGVRLIVDHRNGVAHGRR